MGCDVHGGSPHLLSPGTCLGLFLYLSLPQAAAFWLLSAQGTACGPLLGMTEVVVAGLQFIFKSGFG